MLSASCRRMSRRISSAGWSALMNSRMFSATMCEFFLLRM
jgi:hypothetical protein